MGESNQKQNEEKYVYKFFRWDSLQPLLKNKKLRLERTETWENVDSDGDVYENCVFNSLYNNNLPLEKSNIYGQSWSFNRSSDAMWRIYSQKPLKGQHINDLQKTAVKVKTTIPKLKKVLLNPISPIDYDKYSYMGKVKYMGPKKYKEWLNNSEKNKIIKSLFIKRWAYVHEREYRIIVYVDSEKSPENIEFNIDTNYLFDRFFLDPRLDDTQRKEFENCLVESYGISKEKIDKSSLYTFNDTLTKGVLLDWQQPNKAITAIYWDY